MKKKVFRERYRTVEEAVFEVEKKKMENEINKIKEQLEETKPKRGRKPKGDK